MSSGCFEDPVAGADMNMGILHCSSKAQDKGRILTSMWSLGRQKCLAQGVPRRRMAKKRNFRPKSPSLGCPKISSRDLPTVITKTLYTSVTCTKLCSCLPRRSLIVAPGFIPMPFRSQARNSRHNVRSKPYSPK